MLRRVEHAVPQKVPESGCLVQDVHAQRRSGQRVDAAAAAQRLKDVLYLRGEFMDKNINTLQQFVDYRGNSLDTNTILACFLILIFLVSTVLVRRYRSIR